jgi:hypothetical protein
MTNIIIHQVSSCNVTPRISVTPQQRVDQRASDGYIDATALCKVANKRWESYHRLKSTKDYIDEIARETEIPVAQLIEAKKGKTGGTWVHPKVAVHLARWLSPGLALDVSSWNQQFAAAQSNDRLVIELTNNVVRYKTMEDNWTNPNLGLHDLLDLDNPDHNPYIHAHCQIFILLYQQLQNTPYAIGKASMPSYSDIQTIHDLAWTAYLIKKGDLHKDLKQEDIATVTGKSTRQLSSYSSRVGGWDNFAALISAASALDGSLGDDVQVAIGAPYWSLLSGIVFGESPNFSRMDADGNDYYWKMQVWLNSWTGILDSGEWLTVQTGLTDEVLEEAWKMIMGCYGAEAFSAETTQTESAANWDDHFVSAREPREPIEVRPVDPFEGWEDLEGYLPRDLMPNFGVLEGLPLAE